MLTYLNSFPHSHFQVPLF